MQSNRPLDVRHCPRAPPKSCSDSYSHDTNRQVGRRRKWKFRKTHNERSERDSRCHCRCSNRNASTDFTNQACIEPRSHNSETFATFLVKGLNAVAHVTSRSCSKCGAQSAAKS